MDHIYFVYFFANNVQPSFWYCAMSCIKVILFVFAEENFAAQCYSLGYWVNDVVIGAAIPFRKQRAVNLLQLIFSHRLLSHNLNFCC